MRPHHAPNICLYYEQTVGRMKQASTTILSKFMREVTDRMAFSTHVPAADTRVYFPFISTRSVQKVM